MCGPTLGLLLLTGFAAAQGPAAKGVISAGEYETLQAVVDANPGRVIVLPEGVHRITSRVRLTSDNSGLCGYGTLEQQNPAEPILDIVGARGVRVRDITCARSAAQREAEAPGVSCRDCRDVTLEGIRVTGNCARDAAIEVRNGTHVTVRNCTVADYKRIAIDDRTDSENYGYAFFCIDGTGIAVRESVGTVIEGNRIVETFLFPTRETKDKHRLGVLTEGRYPSKAGVLAGETIKRGYVNNWHQGSAILVTDPEKTRHTRITGNYLQNAAQGIDLHCDNAICSQNTVDHGMMGIKATHGCRNLIITGNLLTHIDLWGILLNPGAASHAAEPEGDGRPARGPNVDAGTLVANNIITDYGCGDEYWNWGGAADDLGGSYPLAFYGGQLATNPPLTDVIVQGNMVYDSARDEGSAPRYRYAVFVGSWDSKPEIVATMPKNLHFSNNVLHPGREGVSNVPLEP